VHINTPKYYRLLLILAIFIPGILVAQTDVSYSKQMAIGLKGGATWSNLVVSFPIQQMNNSFVPSYGLIFTYTDKKTVGIQFEVNYVTKKWEEKTIDNFLYKAELDYLEIPMFTTLHFGNKLKFIINFGPYLGIVLNQHAEESEGFQDSEYYLNYENRIPRKGDFGLNGGAGVRYKTKFGLFQAEIRYIHSLQYIYDANVSTLEYSAMQTVGVYLSYQFLFANEH